MFRDFRLELFFEENIYFKLKLCYCLILLSFQFFKLNWLKKLLDLFSILNKSIYFSLFSDS